MVPAIIVRLVGKKLAPFAFYGAIAALLATGLGLFIWHERSIGAASEIHKQDRREIKVQGQVGAANENAATERVKDATTIQQQTQELKDATRDAKSPDDARARRGCAILRQQGRDTRSVAACQ